MSVIIPIRPLAATSVATGSAAPLLPIGLGLGLGGTGTGSVEKRELEVLKAVAAAVAIADTADSLTVAAAAQFADEDPGARFAGIVTTDLRVVVDEVRRVQGDRKGAPGPDEEQRVVALAVGADPVLVAAAFAKVGDDDVSAAARDWVASIDPLLLERAARAAARREFLNPGAATDSEVTVIKSRLDAIEKRLPAAGQMDIIIGKLDSIDKRLTALEGGSKRGSST
jgi:hypothetical protein